MRKEHCGTVPDPDEPNWVSWLRIPGLATPLFNEPFKFISHAQKQRNTRTVVHDHWLLSSVLKMFWFWLAICLDGCFAYWDSEVGANWTNFICPCRTPNPFNVNSGSRGFTFKTYYDDKLLSLLQWMSHLQDPDFYIDAYGDDEEFEDDIGEEIDETTESPFTVQSCGVHVEPSTSTLGSNGLGTRSPFGPQSSELLIRGVRDFPTTSVGSYHTKPKWRRTSNSACSKRRRSSLLSADVASFDLIPNRRGSLGSGGTCTTRTGQDSLLSKLMKRKLGDLITEESKARWTWIQQRMGSA